MDILNIDEIEDDFGIFEEKNQDDVTNILKQWKLGNNRKDAVFDSRTFTRSKGSLTRSSVDSTQSKNLQEIQNGMCLKIGGLVSNIQKNFLNDISPPNSVCSSLNVENEMSNSLITSADFSNISFFKTSIIDTNVDHTFNNYLKQPKIYEDEKFQGGKNIPNDRERRNEKMISSVSKDEQYCDNINKLEKEKSYNLLTDSTKENSPIFQVEHNGLDFQKNNELSKTFHTQLSYNSADKTSNSIKSNELNERPVDINKTFLRKPKIQPLLNQTFEGKNLTKIIRNADDNELEIDTSNETLLVKSYDDQNTFEHNNSNLAQDLNKSEKILVQPLVLKLNTFENTTSTPQKYECGLDDNIDCSPITPFISNDRKCQKNSNEMNLSSENDKKENIRKEYGFCNKDFLNEFQSNPDIDYHSNLSDKFENYKESAMKKSVETIKKRFSHKFDKTINFVEKSKIQNICDSFPEKGRLLTRRTRLNDDINLRINKQSLKQKNDATFENENVLKYELVSNKPELLLDSEIKHDSFSQVNIASDFCGDSADETKTKKNDFKRAHCDERFKTIKVTKPFFEDKKLLLDETGKCSPIFGRNAKNNKITNFKSHPLKFENKIVFNKNQKSFQQDDLETEPSNQLEYVNITNIENLGKSISTSNLETTEKLSNFQFTVPAPVKNLKSPMGVKAKSFHNLVSNNFGFGVRNSSDQNLLNTKEKSCALNLERKYIKENVNVRDNAPSSSKTVSQKPNNLLKRTGLIRPSSGYFSREAPIGQNNLPITMHKEDRKINELGLKSSNSSNHDLETQFEIDSSKQNKLLKSSESKLLINAKRSGLPRPSVYYRK